MSNQSQELITPELVEKIQQYESSVRCWQATKGTQLRGALYATVVAIPLWAVSYIASATTGPVNQSVWFSAITVFSFIGAIGFTIMALALAGYAFTDGKPVKDFATEKIISDEIT